MKLLVFALLCALLQLNFAQEDEVEVLADPMIDDIDDVDIEEDPVGGHFGGYGGRFGGYGGRFGGYGRGGFGRFWDGDDEEVVEDPEAISAGGFGWGGRGWGGRGWGGRGWGGRGWGGRGWGGRGWGGRYWDDDDTENVDDIEGDEEVESDPVAIRFGGFGRGWGGRFGGFGRGWGGLGRWGFHRGWGGFGRWGMHRGLGLRGYWDDEKDEILSEPQRGGNFRCSGCRRVGRQWMCRICRRRRTSDEEKLTNQVEDFLLRHRIGCRLGLGHLCMRGMGRWF